MGRWGIFQVIADYANGKDGVFFRLRDGVPEGYTEDLDSARPMVTGTIKWDGCFEIDYGPHICGQDGGRAFFKALLVVWEVTAEALTAFDRCCAGLEPQ